VHLNPQLTIWKTFSSMYKEEKSDLNKQYTSMLSVGLPIYFSLLQSPLRKGMVYYSHFCLIGFCWWMDCVGWFEHIWLDQSKQGLHCVYRDRSRPIRIGRCINRKTLSRELQKSMSLHPTSNPNRSSPRTQTSVHWKPIPTVLVWWLPWAERYVWAWLFTGGSAISKLHVLAPTLFQSLEHDRPNGNSCCL
jgi:hypothetical protein